MRQFCTLSLIGLLSVSTLPAGDTPEVTSYVGRWNLEIFETGDSFRTAWLKVEKGDAGLEGALVWKWGSVVPIKDVSVEDGELRFRRDEESYKVKLVNGELTGAATMADGKQFRFVGWRAPEMCEVAGTWSVGLRDEAGGAHASLVFETKGGGITGRATDPDGNSYAIQNAKLDGFSLAFQAVPSDNSSPRDVRCEIRGDTLIGEVTVVPPGETEPKTIAILGVRKREWGTPISLLKENSLEGWKPRDPKHKFGWSIKDGVLENSPPDVDIVSEAEFRDFRLQLEYKVNPGSNSGVYLRGRYELQILGDTRVQDHGNMAVYSRLKPKKNPVKPGEWNQLDVTFIGRWVTVKLNGETVHDNQYLEGITGGAWTTKEGEAGPLLLQGDHGKVWYRNVVVTPVK